MTNECEGCRSFNKNHSCEAWIQDTTNEDKCPCSTCLVKGICKEACEDFKNMYLIKETNE